MAILRNSMSKLKITRRKEGNFCVLNLNQRSFGRIKYRYKFKFRQKYFLRLVRCRRYWKKTNPSTAVKVTAISFKSNTQVVAEHLLRIYSVTAISITPWLQWASLNSWVSIDFCNLTLYMLCRLNIAILLNKKTDSFTTVRARGWNWWVVSGRRQITETFFSFTESVILIILVSNVIVHCSPLTIEMSFKWYDSRNK